MTQCAAPSLHQSAKHYKKKQQNKTKKIDKVVQGKLLNDTGFCIHDTIDR